MPSYTYPGVYVQEISSGARPIEGASTSTTAFVGLAKMGRASYPTLVSSWFEFQQSFGGLDKTMDMPLAVYHYFLNGGQLAYILRVLPASAVTASVNVNPLGGDVLTTQQAADLQSLADQLETTFQDAQAAKTASFTVLRDALLQPAPDPSNDVKQAQDAVTTVSTDMGKVDTLKTKITGEIPAVHGSPTAVEAATLNALAPLLGDMSKPIVLSSLTALPAPSAPSNPGVLTDLRDAITAATTASTSGDLTAGNPNLVSSAQALDTAVASVVAIAGRAVDLARSAIGPAAIVIQAIGPGVWANGYHVHIDLNQVNDSLFDWTIKDNTGNVLETYAGLAMRPEKGTFYATTINATSNYIQIIPSSAGYIECDEITIGDFNLDGGTDGSNKPPTPPTATDYQNALVTLNRVDDVSILVIPAASGDVAVAGASYVAGRKLKDMFYIMDSVGLPFDTRNTDQLRDAVTAQINGFPQKNPWTGLYFPWVQIPDPYSQISGATRFAPPSGMLAGLFARTDQDRGVWKAPAGTAAGLLGAVGLAAKLTDDDQGTLNPLGVNCIRQFPASGIVVWGARTVSTVSQPEWRYVPVRRTASFLNVSLYRGTQWAVFEPNDEPLWSALRFSVTAFMQTLFRAGAFQGSKPEDAFQVLCDASNNPQSSIDLGQVNILVGFAPLKPAEFVIIQIQQMIKQS